MSDPTRDELAAAEARIRERHADWATAADTFVDLLNHPERECWGDLDRHALLVALDNERALRPAPAPEPSGLREAAQAFVDAWDAPAMSTDDLFGIVSAVVPALRAALAGERP